MSELFPSLPDQVQRYQRHQNTVGIIRVVEPGMYKAWVDWVEGAHPQQKQDEKFKLTRGGHGDASDRVLCFCALHLATWICWALS